MVINVTPRPLFRILPTWHIITLTNLMCQIGLIRINTCPSPNTMNKTGIIITTLHRVNEIQLVMPRSREYGDVTATYICRLEIPLRIYAKHHYRKESECGSTVVIYIPTEKYKSHDWVPSTKAENDGLTIPTRLPNPRSLLHVPSPTTRRRTYGLR